MLVCVLPAASGQQRGQILLRADVCVAGSDGPGSACMVASADLREARGRTAYFALSSRSHVSTLARCQMVGLALVDRDGCGCIGRPGSACARSGESLQAVRPRRSAPPGQATLQRAWRRAGQCERPPTRPTLRLRRSPPPRPNASASRPHLPTPTVASSQPAAPSPSTRSSMSAGGADSTKVSVNSYSIIRHSSTSRGSSPSRTQPLTTRRICRAWFSGFRSVPPHDSDAELAAAAVRVVVGTAEVWPFHAPIAVATSWHRPSRQYQQVSEGSE